MFGGKVQVKGALEEFLNPVQPFRVSVGVVVHIGCSSEKNTIVVAPDEALNSFFAGTILICIQVVPNVKNAVKTFEHLGAGHPVPDHCCPGGVSFIPRDVSKSCRDLEVASIGNHAKPCKPCRPPTHCGMTFTFVKVGLAQRYLLLQIVSVV